MKYKGGSEFLFRVWSDRLTHSIGVSNGMEINTRYCSYLVGGCILAKLLLVKIAL